MLNSGNGLSAADVAAVTGGNNGYGNGMFGDWWAVIIILALFGRGGFGFGGYGGSGCGCDSACATVGDVERGFNQQSTNMRFNALDNAFAQLGYANQQQSFDVIQAINSAATAQQQCCCDTQRAIDGVNYNMATGFCNVTNAVNSAARDIVDSQNANYRALHDEIVANRMEDKNAQIAQLQSQVQALNLAQSQANQNQYLIDTLRPCPVPAYQTCNPWGGNVYGSCTCCN